LVQVPADAALRRPQGIQVDECQLAREKLKSAARAMQESACLPLA
jgi:hypothetical protein